MLRIVRHPDASTFLERAEEWLLNREAENNVLLGIAYRLRGESCPADPDVYLATVERDGRVTGCAYRTPPFKFGLTSMPSDAVEMLVESVSKVYDDLPAVLGTEPVVGRFAAVWAERRGVGVRMGIRQCLYRADEVRPLTRATPGYIRQGTYEDTEVMGGWLDGFTRETGVPTRKSREMAELLVDLGTAYVWDDDGPRSMAALQSETRHGVRISYVYTPDEYRGRGYAKALVHELSRQALEGQRDFCVLYTDALNPVSNGLYRSIGYHPVCDVRDYDFLTLP